METSAILAKIKEGKLNTAKLPRVERSRTKSYNEKYHFQSLSNRDFSNLGYREKEDFGVFNVLNCQLMWCRIQAADTEKELLIIRKNLYQFCSLTCKITGRFECLIIIICKAPKNFLNETFRRACSHSCTLNQMYERNTDKMFSRGQNNRTLLATLENQSTLAKGLE